MHKRWFPPHNLLLICRMGCLVILILTTACQSLTPTLQPDSTPVSETPILGSSTPALTSTPTATVSTHRMVPSVWDAAADNFEGNSLAQWGQVSEVNLVVLPKAGWNNSAALSVNVHKRETYLYKTNLMKAPEGYLTFWFNPNHVTIPLGEGVTIPSESIRVADVKGFDRYDVIVALRIWQPTTKGYKAYLEWQSDDGLHFDLDAGQFDIKDGWQKVTLGYRIDSWVALWVDDVLMSEVIGVDHSESLGGIMELGKANDDMSVTPVGALLYDDVAFQFPRIPNLWVDAVNGDDSNSGLARDTAFRNIQTTANLVGPGTTVHILPGVYRESVHPAADGTADEPIVYLGEPGAVVRGSESSRNITWNQLDANSIGLPESVDVANIYVADLSNWQLKETPRFIMLMDAMGNVTARLPLAREPDWQVKVEWKIQEFWWEADGGGSRAGCDPIKEWDCDIASRSFTQLLDASDDSKPQGVEVGNLTSLGDLTGATLVAIDTKQGHYAYHRTIVAHDVLAGLVTVDRVCEHDEGSGEPGLGWGTKYYVEGKPGLLDSPGEWWFDKANGKLYLWSLFEGNPADLNLEISRLQNGFDLSHRSNIVVDSLTFEFFNGSIVHGYNEADHGSLNNTVRKVVLRFADQGVHLLQSVGENAQGITHGFVLQDSEIAFMDSEAIDLSYTWAKDSEPDAFTMAGVTDTIIRGNELHHLGFNSNNENAMGASFHYADHLRFEGNHLHDIARNGVQFSWSLIQSEKEYGFTPEEIKTGNILVKDNIFERTCQLTTDCGALKFWGDPPDGHVYRDVLVMGNTFRSTFGWTSVAQRRGLWNNGMGGFGLYLDMVSGIHVYRNIAYNNGFTGFYIGGVWRDGDVLLYNNIAANSLYGVFFTGFGADGNPRPNAQVMNNILLNNKAYGLWLTDVRTSFDGIAVDFNLYASNGWRKGETDGVLILRRGQDEYVTYPTLAQVRSGLGWEAHGQEGSVDFTRYDVNDHDPFDDSEPDFHLTANSRNAIDKGTPILPDPIVKILATFGLSDQMIGNAVDIGYFEYTSTNSVKKIDPEGAFLSQGHQMENSARGTVKEVH